MMENAVKTTGRNGCVGGQPIVRRIVNQGDCACEHIVFVLAHRSRLKPGQHSSVTYRDVCKHSFM